MPPDERVSVESEVSAADQASARGRYQEAEQHLRRLIGQTRAADYEYDDWLRRLGEIYVRLGRRVEAGYAYLYLHYFDLARQSFGAGARAEHGRCYLYEKRYAEAARELAEAGRPVQAAVALEQAKDHAGARALWASLVGDARLRDRPYERALVHVNLGLATQRMGGDRAEVNRHLAQAQRLIEQVADDYESAGERERAFDCYQILLKLGQDSGSFENLSEGYLNCVRILKQDGLDWKYVLQYYEDFIAHAAARKEHRAAATLYREAADYTVRAGLPYHRHYLRQAADSWWREAAQGLEAGAPLELAENAYLASVECFSLNGEFGAVREAYRKLAALDLGDAKRARYGRIVDRYQAAPAGEEAAPRFPEYMRKPHAYGDIWFVDLVEWEQAGDPGEVAASMVGELGVPDGIRRRALNLILLQADARTREAEHAPAELAAVADALADLELYATLRPLEKLYEHPDARVRRAAVRALRNLFYKRSFGLLRKALHDAEPSVRDAALEALAALHFPHALDPLIRIWREHPEEKVKLTALQSIGRIGTVEAGEHLIDVLRHEPGPAREVARRALSTFDGDLQPILRQHHELEQDPEARKLLEELMRRPGGRR